ncbi:hypothetical protein D0T49_00715 [Paludibacter sp. 221]|uniref:FN3 domain-containing metallophosphoesterase family protein n=1 Tax=Paludibacter sp. 221 TaxID=2302939 RepID=UPI0013D5665A|nr:FN3 domain-containing metallophosphoesterase family protein [Paludibacter sp. 221]NDV45575.1 hypothetical protein [Paludibacter sp. 221]
MKNSINILLCFMAFFSLTLVNAQESENTDNKYVFNHGPYLQGTTDTGTYVYFTTSSKGFSYVELRKQGSENVQKYCAYNDGLIEAYNTMNTIEITGLTPNTSYEYRLVSKEITKFQPYTLAYGDSIASGWYHFKTVDNRAKKSAFVVVNDMHDNSEKYKKLLSHVPLKDADAVFLNGDIMTYFYKPEQPFTSFIDVSVDEFATEKPFIITRGNHETRGPLARRLKEYVLRPDGKYYGLYMYGETAVLVLDSGEDKYDHHREYYGITAFDQYREEQAEWLKKVVLTDEFVNARKRIVIIHIPPFGGHPVNVDTTKPPRPGAHSLSEVNRLFMPVLNNSNIDIMFSGHTHRHALIETGEYDNTFPIVINDNKSILWVESTPRKIHVKIFNEEGEMMLNRSF